MALKIFSGSMLVAGTAIGAGMLALPVVTCLAGFFPSCILYLFCWLFMLATGFLFLEISIWLPKDANIVSMADHLLGKWGRLASYILYLFLFYCLTVAYLAGGGGFVSALLGERVPKSAGILIFFLIFSPFVYFGTRAVNRINLIWMFGLGASYLIFAWIGWQKVDIQFLKTGNWPQAFIAMPIVFTSFSFGGIIPSLISYMGRDVRMVRRALVIGTSVPFCIYVIWQFLILGIVPVEGVNGLLQAKLNGQTAISPLNFMQFPFVYAIGQAFSFFALTTSFLGVGLGLFHFLSDGFQLAGLKSNKNFVFSLVFIPPALIAFSNPSVFLKALNYAGGIGCALLLGLLPVVMSWVGRYKKNYSTATWQLRGGKWVLSILAAFTVAELFIEFFLA